jgi:hypothetical protein
VNSSRATCSSIRAKPVVSKGGRARKRTRTERPRFPAAGRAARGARPLNPTPTGHSVLDPARRKSRANRQDLLAIRLACHPSPKKYSMTDAFRLSQAPKGRKKSVMVTSFDDGRVPIAKFVSPRGTPRYEGQGTSADFTVQCDFGFEVPPKQ